MVELYRALGPSVRKHFTELRPAQVDILEASLSELDGGKGAENFYQAENPMVTVTTNINPGGGSKKKGVKP
jgi:hypothetical protein